MRQKSMDDILWLSERSTAQAISRSNRKGSFKHSGRRITVSRNNIFIPERCQNVGRYSFFLKPRHQFNG